MWITVAEADVLTAFSGTELAAFRAAALKVGQADPVEPTIVQVVDEVRGYVSASNRYTLGEGTTIPQKLLQATLAIIAMRLPARVGMSAGEAREKLADQAIDLLKLVAAGKFGLEEPEIAEDEVTAGPGRPSFCGRERRKPRKR